MGTISKTSPYDLWEIDAVEGWLDDMASQGLLFEHTSGGRFIFRETQPQKVRHRLDIHSNIADPEARRESFLDFGWEHICYIDSKTDIYRAVREDAAELHTDESVLQEALRQRMRRLKWILVLGSVITAVFLVLFPVLILRKGLYFTLLTNSIGDLLTLPLWFFVIIYGDIRLWRSYRDFQQRSLLARSYHTRERERARRKEQRTDLLVRIAIIAVLLVDLIRPDPIALESFPLAGSDYERYSIEQVLPADAGSGDDRVFYKDYALSRMLLFDQYTADGAREYEVQIYKCKHQWLAQQYAKECVRLTDAAASDTAPEESMWYYEGKPIYARHSKYQSEMQNLLLLVDDQVVHISYRGTHELLPTLP